jgi:hypothetical protein
MPDLVTTANQLKGNPTNGHSTSWLHRAVPCPPTWCWPRRSAAPPSPGGAQSKQQQASSVYDDVLRNRPAMHRL